MTHLLVLVLAYDDVRKEGDNDYDGIDDAINSLLIILAAFLGLLHAIRDVHSLCHSFLFDIAPEGGDAPIQFMCAKGLWIDDLSYMATMKMTCFNWCQLKRLHARFDIESQLEPMEEKLTFLLGTRRTIYIPVVTGSTQRRSSCLPSAFWQQ